MDQFCSNPGTWSRSIGLLALLVLLPLARTAQATTIDIMLVYDNTASTWVASNGGMTAFSQDAINRMNQAMQNSGIDLTYRLVHSMQASYNHSSLNTDLTQLTSDSSLFAAVDSARDTYGADLVAMLVDTGSPYGFIGLSWMLTDYKGTPTYAFSVTAIRAVDINHTLTHEVGHNLGAEHSKYQADGPGPNYYLDGEYSAGWYFTGTNGEDYHTIMAYDEDGYGTSYTEAPLFSTPLQTYQGTTAGDANNGDNARLIRETKDTIAAYRLAVAEPDPVDPAPTDPDPDPVAPIDPADPPTSADPFDSSTAFVAQQYRDFFDREGMVSEIAIQAYQLESGTLSEAELVKEFFDDPGFDDMVAPVTRLYFGYFDRLPDTEGLFFWIDAYRNGQPLASISQLFSESSEFQRTYGLLDDHDFVALVYLNVLDRQAEDSGYDFWVGQLGQGLSRGQLMLEFSESEEYQRLSANSVSAIKLAIGLLRRVPTEHELNDRVHRLESGTQMLELIADILQSAEYKARF